MSAGVRAAAPTSLWVDTAPSGRSHPQLIGDVRADVAVLGGGIVGITTALLLAEAGASVVLLEAGRLAGGTSGHTTAKVTSQHGLIYARLAARHGAEVARRYGEANEAALAWIAARVEREAIDCDLRRRPAYAYVTAPTGCASLEREARAAQEAGLPATLVEDAPLPFPVAAALRFDHQAELHPRRYLHALAERFLAAGGQAFERTHAVEIGRHGGQEVVKAPGGQAHADRVVVATHYPFPDRSLGFARLHPERSYLIACRIAGAPPEGMHLGVDVDGPTRSLRAAPIAGEELLLVGGEGHRTGTGGDTELRYERLEAFARRHWEVAEVTHRWSAQDPATLDGLPYVGALTPRDDRVLMASGFAKWGMTGGTAAALLLADLALGRPALWQDLFDPHRLTPFSSAPRFLAENAQVAAHFVGDRVAARRAARAPADLGPGEGAIVRDGGGEALAAFRDEDGTLTALSPRCSHLGCLVAWNRAERSWDCPCHGSRFAPDGTVLEGPATHRLEHKPLGGHGS